MSAIAQGVIADIDQGEFLELRRQANAGDAAALARLRAILAANPGISAKLGDLAAIVERSLCASLDPCDSTVTEVVADKARQLRESLLEGSNCPIVRLAADRVVLGWLSLYLLDLKYPDATQFSSTEANVILKQKLAAERRHQAALRTLAVVRQLTRPTTRASAPEKQRRGEAPPAPGHLGIIRE